MTDPFTKGGLIRPPAQQHQVADEIGSAVKLAYPNCTTGVATYISEGTAAAAGEYCPEHEKHITRGLAT